MEEALVQILLSTPAVTDIIGDRLTWSVRQQGSLTPALVLTKISSVPEYADEGAVNLTDTRIQVDCWSSEWMPAKSLAEAVKARLSGMEEVSGGIDFGIAVIEDEQDSFEIGAGGEALYRRRIDFTISHS